MLLREMFLSETANEDRAIISLAHAVSKMIRQKYPPGKGLEHSVDLGKVSDSLDTPLQSLGNVTIMLNPEGELQDETSSADRSNNITNGLWEPETETIFISDRVLRKADQSLLRILTHEFRHALDDYKSDFRAGKSKGYDTPKNKAYRSAAAHTKYLASPAEINARFAEVMSLMTMAIQKRIKEFGNPADIKKQLEADLHRFLEVKKISSLFPEKEKSKDYKRLMKRAVDFIDKELAYKLQSKK